MGSPLGVMYCIGIYREYMIKSSSETTRHRALIFGMSNNLVDLYRMYSNYAPWAKNGPVTGVIEAWGSHVLGNI